MIGGKKIIAMAENDSIPSLTNMEVEHAYWSYFCPWYDSEQAHFVMGEEYQNVDTLTELYKSDFCITLDELPANLYTDSDTPDDVKVTTTTTTNDSDTDSALKGDANEDGRVSISDAVRILQYVANSSKYELSEQGKINADVDGKAGVTGSDAGEIQKYDAGLIKEFK